MAGDVQKQSRNFSRMRFDNGTSPSSTVGTMWLNVAQRGLFVMQNAAVVHSAQ
jgi:hypothetical protein